MISRYIFFNSDDQNVEALSDRDGKIIQEPTIEKALAAAYHMIWGGFHFGRCEFIHIFEDDGESIAPVITVKRYAG